MNGGRLSVSTKHIAKEEKSGIRIISTIKKYWFIYLLAIPGFIFLVLFSYGPMSVSYTHLDVYKRQALYNGRNTNRTSRR